MTAQHTLQLHSTYYSKGSWLTDVTILKPNCNSVTGLESRTHFAEMCDALSPKPGTLNPKPQTTVLLITLLVRVRKADLLVHGTKIKLNLVFTPNPENPKSLQGPKAPINLKQDGGLL